MSKNVWVYIIALTLMGFRHLISPRWLEEMFLSHIVQDIACIDKEPFHLSTTGDLYWFQKWGGQALGQGHAAPMMKVCV